jgi:predicted nucleic acid-binding protein
LRRREISRGEAGEILAAFDRLPIETVPTSVPLPAAFQVAEELDHTIYDSLYVALAVAEDCAVVTIDRKFHSAVLASSALSAYGRWVEDEL